MESVIREARHLLAKGEPFVIATVVNTKGSTPQKSGAKLLIRNDGSGVGTLGGGCVEGDIWYAAKEALRRHLGPEYRDYYLNEDIAARDGLVCGGTMYFFIEPVWESQEFGPIAKEIVGAYEGNPSVALITLIKTGSQGGEVGAKLFVHMDGACEGSLGTPERDQVAVEAAQQLMDYGLCEHLLTADGSELFVEAYTSPACLVLMGGGHISTVSFMFEFHFLEIGVCQHSILFIAFCEVKHSQVQGMKTSQGDELEFIPHSGQFLLEFSNSGIIQVAFPVERW